MLSRFFLSVLFTVLSLSVFSQISVSTQRSSARYEVGEQITFVVTSNSSSNVNYQIQYDRFSPITTGSVSVQAGVPRTITYTSNEPTTITCSVNQFGSVATATAAVSPHAIQPLESGPGDFDSFWNGQKAQLAGVPMNPQVSFHTNHQFSTTYTVNLGNVDGRRVYGYVTVPNSGSGNYPAMLTLPAFGSAPNNAVPQPTFAEQSNMISMSISIHNADPRQQDPNAYSPDNFVNQNDNYYRYAVLAGIRAIDYLVSRNDVDQSKIALWGNSQGGGLAMLVAGIDNRVGVCMNTISALCQHAGRKYNRASGFPYYLNNAVGLQFPQEQALQAVKYYDAIYAASRFKGQVLMNIGYLDDVTNPATIFAAWNQFTGNTKILFHSPKSGHVNPSRMFEGRFRMLREIWPAETANPLNPFGDNTATGHWIDAGNDINGQANSQISLNGRTEFNNVANSSWPARWEKVSGPGNVNFSNANNRNTSVSFSSNGTYLLRLRAEDQQTYAGENHFVTMEDFIQVNINGNGSNSNQKNQGITFNNIPNQLTTANPFNVSAFASSGLPVSFSIASGPASISGNTISLNGQVGSVTVRANQAGNSEYFAASQVTRTFQVTQPGGGNGGNNNCQDSDNDGTCDEDDCFIWNPTLPAAPGTPCDDFDPHNLNDVIQADGCTCQGSGNTLPGGGNEGGSGGNGGGGNSDCSNPTLLSQGKSAVQSSTLTAGGVTGNASRAVDGNTNGNYFAGSVSATTESFQSWWQVDLGQSYDITQIRVYNRTEGVDRLRDYNVMISDTPFSNNLNNALNGSAWNETTNGQAGSPSEYNLNNTGRYVRIQANGNSYMTLAEVQVYGCAVGSGGGGNSGGETTDPPPTTNCQDSDNDGTCDVDDCFIWNPNLPAAPGTPCNDFDPHNLNDVIQADGCTCQGSGNTLPGGGGNGGGSGGNSGCQDSDNDGTCDADDCFIYNPNLPAAPGTPCDDFDPHNLNDVIQADGCTCQGSGNTLPGGGGNGGGNNSDCSNPTLLSQGKSTVQSSTLTAGGVTGNASRAVDGNTNGNYFAGSVSATTESFQSWWQVDLGQSYDITQIRVYNRTEGVDRLRNYNVMISDTPFSNNLNNALNGSAWNETTNGQAGSPSEYNLNNTGRYVRIQANGNSYMTLAEVQVFGCAVGSGGGGNSGGGNTTPPPTTNCQDSDNDGTCDVDDCFIWNPSLPAAPGTPCNDFDPHNLNDVIQADGCTCQGSGNTLPGGGGNGGNGNGGGGNPSGGNNGIVYCDNVGGNNTSFEYIERVTIGSINNTSGNNGGYRNYTNLSTNATANGSLPLTLSPGFSGNADRVYWRVWVDFNQNGSFDDFSEMIYQGSSRFTISTSVNIPDAVASGTTRMRIAMKAGSFADPCEFFPFGEVEDYSINMSQQFPLIGIEETTDNDQFDFELKPNPVDDYVIAELLNNKNTIESRNIFLSNSIGERYDLNQLEFIIEENRLVLFADDLQPGYYFLSIASDSEFVTKAFVKIE